MAALPAAQADRAPGAQPFEDDNILDHFLELRQKVLALKAEPPPKHDEIGLPANPLMTAADAWGMVACHVLGILQVLFRRKNAGR